MGISTVFDFPLSLYFLSKKNPLAPTFGQKDLSEEKKHLNFGIFKCTFLSTFYQMESMMKSL